MRVFVHEPSYYLNGEITTEAHTVYAAFHRLMVYCQYFRTEMRNTEAHSRPKILIVHSSTKDIKNDA